MAPGITFQCHLYLLSWSDLQHWRATVTCVCEGWLGVHSWEPMDPLEKTHDCAGGLHWSAPGHAVCGQHKAPQAPQAGIWLEQQCKDAFLPAVALAGIQPCYYGLFVSFLNILFYWIVPQQWKGGAGAIPCGHSCSSPGDAHSSGSAKAWSSSMPNPCCDLISLCWKYCFLHITSKGFHGSHCCSVWYLLTVLRAYMEALGYGE